jgi:uncharacterized protein (TIGR03083 family)
VEALALVNRLESDGELLLAAARRAGWDAPVPRTDWTVRDLVTHTGGVHRWAADIVTTCSESGGTPAGAAVGSGPDDDDELAEWFENGHVALVATLRSAAPDLECFTFLPADSPLHFWARRQAHETAIHRVDAEGAAGDEITLFDAAFAQDGMAEILLGFGARKRNAVARAATLGLDAADGPSWLVTFGGERIEAVESEDLVGTDVTVRGLSSDLYRWLWNRPSDAVVDGDEEVAALWSTSVQVRWG